MRCCRVAMRATKPRHPRANLIIFRWIGGCSRRPSWVFRIVRRSAYPVLRLRRARAHRHPGHQGFQLELSGSIAENHPRRTRRTARILVGSPVFLPFPRLLCLVVGRHASRARHGHIAPMCNRLDARSSRVNCQGFAKSLRFVCVCHRAQRNNGKSEILRGHRYRLVKFYINLCHKWIPSHSGRITTETAPNAIGQHPPRAQKN